MMTPNPQVTDRLSALPGEIEDHIKALEEKLVHYRPFTILANIIVNNQFQPIGQYKKDHEKKSPLVQEYVALVLLKSPWSFRIGELTRARQLAKDLYEINELADLIVKKHSVLHHHKYNVFDEDGTVSDLQQIAQSISAEELLVRNPTFEHFHWDQLEELYEPYNDYFKENLGFTVLEAIRICETIADYMSESATESLQELQQIVNRKTEEILAYKHRNKMPSEPYPDEYLAAFKTWSDKEIKEHFYPPMATYQMMMLGDKISFTAKDIAEMEHLEESTVQRFLDLLSIGFGKIKPDFTQPEVMHPLKDRPILRHEKRYLCSSLFLIDYSLDRLFANTLTRDPKKDRKYLLHRHDYLLEKGVKYIAETLKTSEVYTNLYYPGGELDGLILCDTNVFYIEAKGHKITDRAKKGYIDRISNHIDDIVRDSHSQGLRTHHYFFGKKDIEFKDKQGRKVIIDGSRFKNAYFISLTLENVSSISCNLKLNNSLGLFEKGNFPWIVSLYDLRAICEHMEGPAYFIQYLHRRREFFAFNKFQVDDELDILGYYLMRNLRFDDIIEEYYDKVGYIKLESHLDRFNYYYESESGRISKEVPKMKHYTIQQIKDFVAAVQNSGVPNCTDAAVQLLEFGSETKKQLVQYLRKVKKKSTKDGEVHDFRIGGVDTDGRSWMLSYMVDKDTPEALERFRRFVRSKNQESPSDSYIAIFDTATDGYRIKEIEHFLNHQVL